MYLKLFYLDLDLIPDPADEESFQSYANDFSNNDADDDSSKDNSDVEVSIQIKYTSSYSGLFWYLPHIWTYM